MKTKFTEWAAARVLPFPGQAWKVRDLDVRKAEAKIGKAGGGDVPAQPTAKAEIERAGKLRVHERYGADGNNPRHDHGSALIDIWVARRGVAFALECAIGVSKVPRTPQEHLKNFAHPYMLGDNASPWARLREHVVASGTDITAVAKKAYKAYKFRESDLPFALAYITCNPAWVDACVANADEGAPEYGQTCVLAAIADPARASAVLRIVREGHLRFNVDEHALQHMPTLMTVLPDGDADYLVEIATECENKAVRKPWFPIIGSLTTPAAKAYLKKFADDAPKPKPAKKR